MERYEVGNDGRLSALIHAARRGDEAVLTRGGEPVATVVPKAAGLGRGDDGRSLPTASSADPIVLRTRDGGEPRRDIDWAALDALHARLPPALRGANTAALIREMRDMDDH